MPGSLLLRTNSSNGSSRGWSPLPSLCPPSPSRWPTGHIGRIAVLQRLLEISSWVRPTFEFPKRDLMLSFSDAGQLHDAVARRPRREVRSPESRRAWLWLWISETASLARRWDGGLVEAWETSWAQSMGRLLWPAKDDPTGDKRGF